MSDPGEVVEFIARLIPFAAEKVLSLESGEVTGREDRAPYPPDQALEILPPIDEKKAALKRKATDNEFWEVM